MNILYGMQVTDILNNMFKRLPHEDPNPPGELRRREKIFRPEDLDTSGEVVHGKTSFDLEPELLESRIASTGEILHCWCLLDDEARDIRQKLKGIPRELQRKALVEFMEKLKI
jgi:hypothetical protein